MSRFDNKLTTPDGVPLRTELVAVCQSEFAAMGNTEPDLVTAFLQVVPVDDAEFEFARASGIDALLERFEAVQIDVYDINRPSAVG